jgi:tryptophanase
MQFQTAEPFRIKMIEHVKKTNKAQRSEWLKQAQYNVFKIKAGHVYIDCLTDSGTSAMSKNQWAALMMGDESYASCDSYFRLEASVHEVLGFPFLQPVHQGRAADYLLAKLYTQPGKITIGNMHFDTFRGNAEVLGALVEDMVHDAGKDAASAPQPFKGNIDLSKCERIIQERGVDAISVIILTITCNNNGGQPVSMQNIKDTAQFAKKYGIPFVMDIARVAENAYFIKTRELAYQNHAIADIIKESLSYCETAVMSAKKDGLVNIGGLFLSRRQDIMTMANQLAIVHEGFLTYGGLAGRDLDALAVGLREVCDFEYLDHRIKQVQYLGDQLIKNGIPIIEPTGGHGVYVDARRFFDHIPQHQFPAQRLVVALYEEAGIRGVELGACAFGTKDPLTHEAVWPQLETMRLAISRRVYTNAHIDCIVNALAYIYAQRKTYQGLKLVYEGPIVSLRHFTAGFELL